MKSARSKESLAKAAFLEKLTTQRRNLGTSGLIDLRNVQIPTFTLLGIQPKLRKLIVSDTNITSFETLPSQPVMTHLVANRTKINSYVGLSRQPRLSSLSLKSTPLSERANFRIETLIVVGQHLMTLNNEPITQEERNVASQYPVIAQSLIEVGWELVYPCPSADDFRELATNYGLRFKGVDKYFTNENSEKYLKPPPQAPCFSSMHETVIGVSTEAQNDSKLEEKKQAEEMYKDKEMMEAIAFELKRIGVHIPDDDNMEENIISAVQSLADIVKTLEPCGDKLIEMTEETE